jgi:hypothetical protein
MMMEDKFYKNVHAKLANFQPEVPASVYRGVRRKMWVKSFTSFQLTRFNMWYALVAVAIAGGVWASALNNESSATKAEVHETEMLQFTGFSNPTTTAQEAVDFAPSSAHPSCQKPSQSGASCSSQSAGASCTAASNSSKPAQVDAAVTVQPEAPAELIPVSITKEQPKAVAEMETVQPKEIEQPKLKGKKVVVPILVDEKK